MHYPSPFHTPQGESPFCYQWHRDGKRLTVATSTTPLLVIVDAAPCDAGAYHCVVSNAHGSIASARALVSVVRLGRVATATSDGASTSGGSGSITTPLLPSTLAKRSIVPRSLTRGGSGLPYSPQAFSAVSRLAGMASPLRPESPTTVTSGASPTDHGGAAAVCGSPILIEQEQEHPKDEHLEHQMTDRLP